MKSVNCRHAMEHPDGSGRLVIVAEHPGCADCPPGKNCDNGCTPYRATVEAAATEPCPGGLGHLGDGHGENVRHASNAAKEAWMAQNPNAVIE